MQVTITCIDGICICVCVCICICVCVCICICVCIQDRAGYHEALADLKAALEDASLDQVDLNIQFLLLALKVNKSQMIGCQI